MHGGTHQLGILLLQPQLPLFHFIQQTVEIFTKAMKFFDTSFFYPPREVAILTGVMNHIGDVLYLFDHAMMQGSRNGERNDRSKKNAAGEYGE